jgi:magnesium-transporting ATPase (P-type)
VFWLPTPFLRRSARVRVLSGVEQRLSGIQNFGAMDVLCTDKTGTSAQDKVVSCCSSTWTSTLRTIKGVRSRFCVLAPDPFSRARAWTSWVLR